LNSNTRRERVAINATKEYLVSKSEGFEPRFPDGWGGVLVYLTHDLNVITCPRKREILNE
jgi:hypothetical protein